MRVLPKSSEPASGEAWRPPLVVQLESAIRDRFERTSREIAAVRERERINGAGATSWAKQVNKIRGPESPAAVGDRVRGPVIMVGPSTVLSAHAQLAAKAKADPKLLDKLRASRFPSDPSKQLEWALAYAPHEDRLSDPLWSVASNDSSPALVAYVRGILSAHKAGIAVDAGVEGEVEKAQAKLYKLLGLEPSRYGELSGAPFPSGLPAQISWALGVLLSSWDPLQHPVVQSNPIAKAVVDLVAGILSKKANNETAIEVKSERRTVTVGDDTRVYAIHTPPGPKPPHGWPTVVFFHGSYGGYAPEQSPDYQALNAIADQRGFQVLYPVGLPQDRADLIKTGRGMLNWDPIGAGPGGANDTFVHQVLTQLIGAGTIDRRKVFVAGHSQGGFYVSNLIAAYPRAFAGAAIFGAGAGTVAGQANFGSLSRKTPLFLHCGADDIHLPFANDFALRLQSSGWGSQLKFVRPPGRGHEVEPADYEKMFESFAKEPSYDLSLLGALDGSVGEVGPVYRPFIDLSDPPDDLGDDPEALALLKTLAEHPMLDLDSDSSRITADEWRLALVHLESWPKATRDEITALRRYFVLASPPADQAVDLDAPPPEVAADPDAMAALRHIAKTPALDLDGYPSLISRRELDVAARYLGALPAEVQRGVVALRAKLAAAGKAKLTSASD
jgi:predicted esterase